MKAIIIITAATSYDALPNIQSINQPTVQPQSLQLKERRGERQASVNASVIIKLTVHIITLTEYLEFGGFLQVALYLI